MDTQLKYLCTRKEFREKLSGSSTDYVYGLGSGKFGVEYNVVIDFLETMGVDYCIAIIHKQSFDIIVKHSNACCLGVFKDPNRGKPEYDFPISFKSYESDPLIFDAAPEFIAKLLSS